MKARRFVLALLLILGACGGAAEPGGDEGDGAQQEARITSANYGDDWPFTVGEGTLHCEGSDGVGAVTFEAEGTVYGLNGTAKSRGFAEVDPIWLGDPQVEGLKQNVGPIIERGLALCR